MFGQHLTGALRVMDFASPPGVYSHPRPIPEGIEEIAVITGGRGCYHFAWGDVPVRPGMVFWYCAGQDVIATADGRRPYEVLVMFFSVTKARFPKAHHFAWSSVEHCLTFARHARFYRERGLLDDPDVVLALYAGLEHQRRLAEESEAVEPVPPALAAAREIVRREACRGLTVDTVARRVRLSPSHLRKLYREHFGDSLGRAIREVRLNTAEHLLRTTNLSVKEITQHSGYEDYRSFLESFRERTGHTPSEYRQATVRDDR